MSNSPDKNNFQQTKGEMLIYLNQLDEIKIDVQLIDESVWLTQEQMAQLFGKAKSTINEHIRNIFAEGELQESVVLQKFGNSEFQHKAPNYYNLDVIISIGYRKALNSAFGPPNA